MLVAWLPYDELLVSCFSKLWKGTMFPEHLLAPPLIVASVNSIMIFIDQITSSLISFGNIFSIDWQNME